MRVQVEIDGKLYEIEVESEAQIDLAVEEIRAQNPPPTVGSELKAATVGGVARGALNVGTLVEQGGHWLGRNVAWPLAQMAGGRMPDRSNYPLSNEDFAGQGRQAVKETVGEPQTLPGRMLEAPIRGATAAALMTPLAPLSVGVTIPAMVGEASSQAAEELGAPPEVQLAAGFLGGAGTGVGIARHAARGQRAAAAAAGELSPAEKIAAARLVRQGIGTDKAKLRRAARMLDDEVIAQRSGAFPQTTTGTLQRRFPGVLAEERGLIRNPTAQAAEFRSRLAAFREAAETRIARGAAVERMGVADDLLSARTGAKDSLWAGVNRAYREYRKIRGSEPPPLSIKPLRTTARKVLKEAGTKFKNSAVPKLGLQEGDDAIAAMARGDIAEMSMKELDEFRSLATNEAYMASRAGNKALAKNWYRMRDAADRTLQRAALGSKENAAQVAALKNAIGKRREYGELFDERLGASQLFEWDDLVVGFRSKVLGAKRPAQEMQRLRMIIAQSDNPEAATRALRKVTFESVFGPQSFTDITPGEMKRARNLLFHQKNREVLDAAYYPGRARELQTAFERGRRVLEGTQSGTVGEVRSTGTSAAQRFFEGFLDLRTAGVVGGARAMSKLLSNISTEKMDEAVMRFFLEPEYAARMVRAVEKGDFTSAAKLLGKTTAQGARPTISRIGDLADEGRN